MYKTKLAVISDIIFLATCFFISFFILLNYFIGRVNAIILSLWLTVFFTTLTGSKSLKKQRQIRLTHAQRKECQTIITHLNLSNVATVTQLFFNAFEKQNLSPVKKSGGIATLDNKVYFFRFSFDAVTKAEVVKLFNRITTKQTLVVCSESFNKELTDFAQRFNGKVTLLDGQACYKILLDNNALPKQTQTLATTVVKSTPYGNFVKRKNAKKFFLFGVVFFAMSFLVPIRLYYIICGCVMLAISVLVFLFGHSTTSQTP